MPQTTTFVFDSSLSANPCFLMGSMSHMITLHGLTASSTRCSYAFNDSNSRFKALAVPTRVASVFAKVKSKSSTSSESNNSAIDFSDPDWKTKFKDDSEDRFRLPHVTDIFPDAVSMPSTFSPNMRLVRLYLWILVSFVECFCSGIQPSPYGLIILRQLSYGQGIRMCRL